MRPNLANSKRIRAVGERLVCALLLALATCNRAAIAQSAAPDAARPPDSAASKPADAPPVKSEADANKPPPTQAVPLVEVKPAVTYVRDEAGKLVPVPNLSLERLQKLLAQGAAPAATEKPAYSIQELRLAGEALADQVQLKATINILVTGKDWVKVPLGLGRAALRDPEYTGGGEHYLDPDKDGRGYVCWLRGEPLSTHTLTVSLAVPLPKGEHRLELDLPQAVTSELSLTVSADQVSGVTASGASLPKVESQGKGKSTISVVGIKGGDFKLAWREADVGMSSSKAALEVSALVIAKVDVKSVNFEATLTVRSLRGQAPFNRFRVRLPAGAQLVGSPPADYTLTANDPKNGAVDVDVQLNQSTVGPVDVKLAAERPYDSKNNKIDLGGFAVVEPSQAVRQFGSIGVMARGETAVHWAKPVEPMRQIEDFPDASLRRDLAASFEYSSQPASLWVTASPNNMRVTVDPEYIYYVDSDQVRLEAHWKYNIRTKLFGIDFDFPDSAGWEFDEVSPAGALNLDNLTSDGTGFSLPLSRDAAALTGEVEVVLKGHMMLPAGAKSVAWSLPRPKEPKVNSATVIVVPADNVELAPRLDKTGLTPAPQAGAPAAGPSPPPAAPATGNTPAAGTGLAGATPASAKLSPREQEPLVYHAEAAAHFVADLQIRTRAIAVEAANQLQLQPQATVLQQRLTYHIRYEPATQLTFDVPAALAERRTLELEVDGHPLSLATLPTTPATDVKAVDDAAPRTVRMAATLARPRIGALEAKLSYRLPQDELPLDTPTNLSIPLVMPADCELAANRLVIDVAAGLRVDRVDAPWTAADTNPSGAPLATTEWVARNRTPEVRLSAVLENLQLHGSTVVDRAWLQTWLGDAVRQDRVAYHFISTQDQLELKLPAGVKSGEFQALLDGKSLEIEPAAGKLVVPLPASAIAAPHTLELRYRLDNALAGQGSENLVDLPTFAGGAWVRRTYWQLILPRDKHLIEARNESSAELISEMTCGWRGGFWGRIPLLNQLDLESWVGVPHDRSLPDSVNQYLFSALATDGRFEFRAAPRALIAGLASLAALLLGLLLIYVRVLRHPIALLALAAVVAAAALTYPEMAQLVAEAAALGIVLALVAGLLQRWMVRRRARLGTVRTTTSGSSIERRTDLQFAPAPGGSHASAPTASITLEVSAGESHA